MTSTTVLARLCWSYIAFDMASRRNTGLSKSSLIMAFVIVAGCASETEDSPIVSDAPVADIDAPKEDGHRPTAPSVVHATPEETGNDSRLNERPAYLRHVSITGSLGDRNGRQDAVFGMIADARTDEHGRTFVLDTRFQRIAVYGETGALLETHGHPGRGPGEFREPGGLAWREGALLALDIGNMRIHVFQALPEGLMLAHAIRLPFMARSFCTIGPRIYLAGLYEGKTVHEIDMAGEILKSFGDAYPGEEIPPGQFRSTLQASMSAGLIACSARPELVVALPRNRPEVTAYSTDGHIFWQTTLSGYSQMVARMTDRGTMQYAGDPRTGGQHTAQGVVIWPPGNVLLQLAYLSPSGYRSSDEAPPETRVLSLATGQELATVADLPRIAEIGDTHALGFLNIPFPQVFYLAIQ